MSNEHMQVIEINGIKMEVDTRHATRIDTFRVGTKVKLMEKSTYSTPQVYPGVVVGFEPFESAPTIIVCYLSSNYSDAELKFAYINSETREKYELIASIDDDLPVEKSDVLAKLDREMDKKRDEIGELERKRGYFLEHFNKYFEPAIEAE